MAAVRNFTLYRGTAPTLKVGPIKDEVGATVDVTGWVTQLTVRTSDIAADPVFFSKAGAVQSPGTAGIITVALTKANTLTFAKRDYEYSIERTDVGVENLITIGIITVKLDILNPQ